MIFPLKVIGKMVAKSPVRIYNMDIGAFDTRIISYKLIFRWFE